jgi:cyclase
MRIKLLAVAALAAAPAAAQQDFSQVEIKADKVAEGVYMLTGRGGNIGLSVGKSGALMVDGQYRQLSAKILAAVKAITPEPLRIVANTHWHSDHVDGNENLGRAGALLVAHENVRRRMSSEQFMGIFGRKVPPSPEGALPVVTFTDAVTFHWNGDEIHVFHVDPAHTDGDAVVHFVKADVIHMGDLFFNGGYPFIDTSSGGRIDGVIAAADKVLALAGADTRIIPGHGPLATKADLQSYRDTLSTLRGRIVG